MTGRIVKTGRFAASVLGVLLGAAVVAQAALAQSFIDGSEDVPLAPTLQAVDGAGMVFDSPSGRIVEAFATGETDRDTVLAFYAKSLPALGWTADDDGSFRREGERLSIDFFGQDGTLSVRFTLAPE